MQLLEAITNRAKEEGLDLLLAGGHAVIAHGYQPVTFDVDLAIRRTDRERWLELMCTLGFTLFHEGPAFIQFNPPPGERLPVDLIHLNDDTFRQLQAASLPNPLTPSGPSVISLRHLVAMKCHAVKHGHAGRVVKDVDDVIHLFMANRLDPGESAPAVKSIDLGLPELNGMDCFTPRLSAADALRRNDEYIVFLPPRLRGRQIGENREVEFIL